MNLLVIVTDTLRWDYVSAYGNDWIETPYLDELAAESALFLDAYAEGLPTIPARRVIMTGRNIVPFAHRPQKSDGVQLHGWHPLFDEDEAHPSGNGEDQQDNANPDLPRHTQPRKSNDKRCRCNCHHESA